MVSKSKLLLAIPVVIAVALLSLLQFSSAQLEGLEGMDAPDDVTGMDCSMCHGDFAENFKFPHEPAAAAMCTMCHLESGEDTHGGLVMEGRELCLTCHADQEEHYEAFTCYTSTCHSDMHGSDVSEILNPNLEAKYPGFFESTWGAEYVGSENCLSCHAEMGEWWRETAHSFSDTDCEIAPCYKGCESCHGPGGNHFSAPAGIGNFAYADYEESNELCLKCHKDETFVPDYLRNTHSKSAVACVSCHNPHNLANQHNLRLNQNLLCVDCHETVRASFAKMSRHPVDFEDPKAGLLCTDCHDPHAGEGPLMLTEEPDEMCASCHVDKLGPFVFEHPGYDPDMGRGCQTCHSAHSANNPDLLKLSGRGVCLQCHNDQTNHFAPQTCWTAGCHTGHHGSNASFFFFGN